VTVGNSRVGLIKDVVGVVIWAVARQRQSCIRRLHIQLEKNYSVVSTCVPTPASHFLNLLTLTFNFWSQYHNMLSDWHRPNTKFGVDSLSAFFQSADKPLPPPPNLLSSPNTVTDYTTHTSATAWHLVGTTVNTNIMLFIRSLSRLTEQDFTSHST